jgi:beta-lactamase superfamily II metal-dependent hydrolase
MTLKLRIHDVGHGQAIHAFTPKGETVVIDLGCSSSHSPLEWLRKQTSTIDLLVITHPHGDHIDEIPLVGKLGFNVRQLWRPKWLPADAIIGQNQSTYKDKLNAYFEMSARFTQTILDGQRVGDPNVSGGVSITIYDSRTCGTSNINNHSGVVVFEYCGVNLIIPGDNEPPSWRALMGQSAFAKAMSNAHMFMASHHGRESGYCSDIFQQQPLLCAISDGPVQDTNAGQRYSNHASGWDVNSRSRNVSEKRKCITTRCDGYIEVGVTSAGLGRAYLLVSIN